MGIYTSIVSFWEMAIKDSRGKLLLPCSITQIMEICNDDLMFPMLSIEPEHLEKLRVLPWRHKDPFDRLIIAQAISEGVTLITADEYIKGYEVDTIWEM